MESVAESSHDAVVASGSNQADTERGAVSTTDVETDAVSGRVRNKLEAAKATTTGADEGFAQESTNSVDGPVTAVKRRGRPRKNPVSVQVVPAGQQPHSKSTAANSPGALSDVPEGLLQQRRDSNPRENPNFSAGSDAAYD